MVVEIVASIGQYLLMLSFLACPIKIKSPRNSVISLGVVLYYFSDFGHTFHCCAI
jgi:hypothetical protein